MSEMGQACQHDLERLEIRLVRWSEGKALPHQGRCPPKKRPERTYSQPGIQGKSVPNQGRQGLHAIHPVELSLKLVEQGEHEPRAHRQIQLIGRIGVVGLFKVREPVDALAVLVTMLHIETLATDASFLKGKAVCSVPGRVESCAYPLLDLEPVEVHVVVALDDGQPTTRERSLDKLSKRRKETCVSGNDELHLARRVPFGRGVIELDGVCGGRVELSGREGRHL